MNVAVGGAVTVMFWLEVAEQPPEFTVRPMVFVPALPYDTVCGPTPVAVIGNAPIPNAQA